MEVAVACVDTVQSRMKWEHWGGESLSFFFPASFFSGFSSSTTLFGLLFSFVLFSVVLSYLSHHSFFLRGSKVQGDSAIQGSAKQPREHG